MLTLKVKDMSCGHCVATVTKTVKGLDPAAEVGTDLTARTVQVESSVDAAAIVAALDDAGYPSVRI
ncbi:heavy metal transport/detoxification protein [Kaistia sp. 32K]|uniref:heavy-metal-associated domain-containing protein n=1 Tax=Kaistia sp. 32K TaxID=2795690 RepID=UPI001915728A|nr:heavy-metal-associated domain-containing protein [Kaistia sp. 32K]BCP54513.1 heavy metal transport/detoxification protein [Kaistia sp. 32K]